MQKLTGEQDAGDENKKKTAEAESIKLHHRCKQARTHFIRIGAEKLRGFTCCDSQSHAVSSLLLLSLHRRHHSYAIDEADF